MNTIITQTIQIDQQPNDLTASGVAVSDRSAIQQQLKGGTRENPLEGELYDVTFELSEKYQQDLVAIRQRVIEEGGFIQVGGPGHIYERLNFRVSEGSEKLKIEYYGFTAEWDPSSPKTVQFDRYQTDFPPLNDVFDGMKEWFDPEMKFRLEKDFTEQIFSQIDEALKNNKTNNITLELSLPNDEKITAFYRFDGELFFTDTQGNSIGQLSAWRDGSGRGNFDKMKIAGQAIIDGNYSIVINQN
jgi:hypothetical protein